MTILTASEARRLIDKLHHNQTKEHGISILEEKYLAALEIALPVLEQQEMITDNAPLITDKPDLITDTYRQIENDGWIEWGGGERPVDRDCEVGIRYRDGEKDTGIAGYQSWRHYAADDDIIAYRVIENDGREG